MAGADNDRVMDFHGRRWRSLAPAAPAWSFEAVENLIY
jgi:hypothetical protein